MTQPIRVLIAESSAQVRQALVDRLNATDDVIAAFAVGCGQDAVEILRHEDADVVLLDAKLPDMDGVAALRVLRELDKDIPVLIFSSASVRGVGATLNAIAAGANDFVPKPSFEGSSELLSVIDSRVIPSLRRWHNLKRFKRAGKAQSQGRTGRRQSDSQPSEGQPSSPKGMDARPPKGRKRLDRVQTDIVALTSSTGGPFALRTVLRGLPADLPVPLLVVQPKLSAVTMKLVDQLNQQCPFPVRIAEDGDPVRAGEVLFAPGDRQMRTVEEDGQLVVRLHEHPGVDEGPSADELFHSLAQQSDQRILAVVMTGMGQDGRDGCKAIKERGGTVIAQHRDSCTIWGMPRAVEEAGLADFVLPLSSIASAIVGASKHDNTNVPSGCEVVASSH